jgi:hypothetical protein
LGGAVAEIPDYEPDAESAPLTEPVGEFTSPATAEMIVGILRGENVRARVVAGKPLAGLPSQFQVLVAPGAAHRARWILRDSDLTERELCYLATGEFGPDPE